MFCNKCGNAIQNGASFCTACGQPVKRVINANNIKASMDKADSFAGIFALFAPISVIISKVLLWLSSNLVNVIISENYIDDINGILIQDSEAYILRLVSSIICLFIPILVSAAVYSVFKAIARLSGKGSVPKKGWRLCLIPVVVHFITDISGSLLIVLTDGNKMPIDRARSMFIIIDIFLTLIIAILSYFVTKQALLNKMIKN